VRERGGRMAIRQQPKGQNYSILWRLEEVSSGISKKILWFSMRRERRRYLSVNDRIETLKRPFKFLAFRLALETYP